VATVLIPIPDVDFDPTEVAVSWQVLTRLGHAVVFSTESGRPAVADDLMVTGRGLDVWSRVPGLGRVIVVGRVLRASGDARAAYARMVASSEYRQPIARQLSEATRQRITIGKLDGHWSGFNLQLTLGDIVVYDRANQPALTLQSVDSTLSWWSLIFLEPRFDSIEIVRPALNVRRDAQGVISVAGIELNQHTDDRGVSDWLLRQEEIAIRLDAHRFHEALVIDLQRRPGRLRRIGILLRGGFAVGRFTLGGGFIPGGRFRKVVLKRRIGFHGDVLTASCLGCGCGGLMASKC